MELKFNLKRNDVPVTIEGGDGVLNLRLVEMSAAMRDQYLDTIQVRMGYSADGKPAGIRKFDGMQSDLLTRCLLKEDGKPVTKQEVQNWPASLVNQLFTEAQKLNHLSDGQKIPEKKE